jgi:ATP-binding cassette subfamily B protein
VNRDGLGSINDDTPSGVDDAWAGSDRADRRRARRRLLAETLQPYRARVAGAGGAVVISTAAQLGMAFLVQRAIDRGLVRHDRGELIVCLALFAAAVAVDRAAQAVAQRLAGRTAEDATYDLRNRLWAHVQDLAIPWFEQQRSGRVISRATTDVEAVYELFSQAALTVVSSLLLMVGIAVVLIVYDPPLALAVLAVIPVLLIATRVFRDHSERAYQLLRERIALVLVHLSESLAGIRVVQACTREPLNLQQFETINSQHLDANATTIRLMSVYGPGVDLIGQLAVVVVMLVGGLRAAHGSITVGVLTVFLLLVRQFFDPLQELSQFFNSLQAANAGLEKIAGVLATPSSVPDPGPAHEPDAADQPEQTFSSPSGGHMGARVELDRVTFAYPGAPGEPVLHDVSLTIEPGETLALVGPTGAGKSTIAKLIARFYDPTEGRVLIDGCDARRIPTIALRRSVAIVPQEAFLFSATIADNIALGREWVSPDRVAAAGAVVGVDRLVAGLPQGYDTPVDRRGARLSGGQRQLIAFARAWLAEPDVLILDEATSALDLPNERLVQRAVATLLAGRTAIIIAHRLSSIEIADRVAVVEDGRVVELGTAAELLAGPTRYRDLYDRWAATLA